MTDNVRELEGTLASLMAHATLTKKRITLQLAQEVLEKIVTVNRSEVSVEKIRNTVSDYFGITNELMLSNTRKREIVQARQDRQVPHGHRRRARRQEPRHRPPRLRDSG